MQPETALVARICHDLITPLNAINLGLESLEISKDSYVLESMKESTDKANALLKFMRELFSEKEQNFYYSSTSLNKSIAEYLRYYKIAFTLESNAESIYEIFGKLIMLTGVVVKECMPFGGKISCVLDTQTDEISIQYSGTNITEIPKNKEEELTHKTIFRYFWRKIMEEVQFEYKIMSDTDSISIYLQGKQN